MKISVVTWNMDHWKRTIEQHEKAWTYLTEIVSADIMLLQEFALINRIDDKYKKLYRDIDEKRKWGSAVVTRDLRLEEVKFKNSYPGAVAAAEVTLPNSEILTVISLYGMFDEQNYVTAALHRVLSDLTPLLHKEKNKRLFVIAGDYNLSKQWDERYHHKDPSHRIFFDRLEDFGLVDCTFQYFNKYVQTNRHARSDFPWQNDYIHVSQKLAKKLVSCEVKDDILVHELSDHNPVIAVFDV
jgi:exonuclease III